MLAIITTATAQSPEGAKTMEPITMNQWLELHKRSLDVIRGAIAGLTQEQLEWEQPMLKGQVGEPSCGEPRPYSIANLVAHVIGAEIYWLREVSIQPEFKGPPPKGWTVKQLQQTLDQAEKQYEKILAERPNDPDILFGLGRVCQHNLSHWKSMEHLRMLQDPDWRQPEDMTAELAVDYITDLMILGGKAPLKVPDSHKEFIPTKGQR